MIEPRDWTITMMAYNFDSFDEAMEFVNYVKELANKHPNAVFQLAEIGEQKVD